MHCSSASVLQWREAAWGWGKTHGRKPVRPAACSACQCGLYDVRDVRRIAYICQLTDDVMTCDACAALSGTRVLSRVLTRVGGACSFGRPGHEYSIKLYSGTTVHRVCPWSGPAVAEEEEDSPAARIRRLGQKIARQLQLLPLRLREDDDEDEDEREDFFECDQYLRTLSYPLNSID